LSAAKQFYDDLIMDHIKSARNYRQLDHPQVTAEKVNPLCGDKISLYLAVQDSTIRDASFQCSCCGISMASASILTETVQGLSVGEAQAVARSFAGWLKDRQRGDAPPLHAGLSAIAAVAAEFPARVVCATLAWDALAEALAAPG
jgi:nitrogen fixation protein NifU and related proteins